MNVKDNWAGADSNSLVLRKELFRINDFNLSNGVDVSNGHLWQDASVLSS